MPAYHQGHVAYRIDSQVNTPAIPSVQTHLPARLREWLACQGGRFWVLAVAAFFSLPAIFAAVPDVGLDPSWQLSLQLAVNDGKVFGKEFVFTYGPLGWLLLQIPVSKVGLLLYNLFVLGSLLSIYRGLLPERPRPMDAALVIALAMLTKVCLLAGPSGVLFSILCYWLWRIYDKGNALAVSCSLASAVVLFFGKVNYGVLTVLLMAAYGIGLMILRKDRRIAGLVLLAGFPLLILLGRALWNVDLRGYLRSGLELISGYNDTMFLYPTKTSISFETACLSSLAMAFVAFRSIRRLGWPEQAMILPLVGGGAFLLFKNGFVRSDEGWGGVHSASFQYGLPLLLAWWCVAWRSESGVRALLVASMVYPMALLIGKTEQFGRDEVMAGTPLRYLKQVVTAPWRQNARHLESTLQARFPDAVLPADIRARIGRSSVDVMPWESSIAVLNGLALKQRPVPQSYSVYTPWLDEINASFLSSPDAPDFVLYARAQQAAIDERPAAWDESITKRALMENYVFASEFITPMRLWAPSQKPEPGPVFVLKRVPGARRLVPVSSTEVNLTLGQPFPIPATGNLLFLTLKVDQTIPGRLRGAVLSPGMLAATVEYNDGTSRNYRAALPILKTGVLLNWRVESADEIRNWLQGGVVRNAAASSIVFRGSSSWAFKPQLKGTVVEYRVVQDETPAPTSFQRPVGEPAIPVTRP